MRSCCGWLVCVHCAVLVCFVSRWKKEKETTTRQKIMKRNWVKNNRFFEFCWYLLRFLLVFLSVATKTVFLLSRNFFGKAMLKFISWLLSPEFLGLHSAALCCGDQQAMANNKILWFFARPHRWKGYQLTPLLKHFAEKSVPSSRLKSSNFPLSLLIFSTLSLFDINFPSPEVFFRPFSGYRESEALN